MCPPGQSADGSGKDESEQSNSGESGVYRFPKSNVSEIQAQEERRRQILDGTWRDPETGKTAAEEARDSAQMLGFVLAYAGVVGIGCAIGAYLIWGR
jgi:hypothetical protein